MSIEQQSISHYAEIDRKLEEELVKLTSSILSYLPKGLVRRIVHYGSTANGTARPDSDIDIAVLVDENDIWNSKHPYFGYKPTGKQKLSALEIYRFLNYLDQTQTFKEPYKRLAIYFVTPHDLGYLSFLTEHSPRGDWGDAILDGRNLYCNPSLGWWHKGEGIKFIPTEEPYLYRAAYLTSRLRELGISPAGVE